MLLFNDELSWGVFQVTLKAIGVKKLGFRRYITVKRGETELSLEMVLGRSWWTPSVGEDWDQIIEPLGLRQSEGLVDMFL